MDVQKEREAFKSWAYSKKWNISRVRDHYVDDFVNGAWHGWQAKAQEVPEGFVLVEREKLAMIFETATNALVYHAAQPKHDALSIIQGISRKAMIEAQEPK